MSIEKVKVLEKQISESIHSLHFDIGERLYPELFERAKAKDKEAEKHLKVKHYQAIDRIKMYLAHDIARTTFYNFSIEKLVSDGNVKVLEKIVDALSVISYDEIREKWHRRLKPLFYAQKNSKKVHDKMNNCCIIGRLELEHSTGFVRIVDGKLKIVQNIADATEFPLLSPNKEKSIEFIDNILVNEYMCGARLFLNPKIYGRSIYH